VVEPASIKIFTGNVPVEISDLYPVLQTVTLQIARTAPGVGNLVFTAGRNEMGEWPVIDGGYFERWSPIRVQADFGTYAEDVLWGYVVKITPDFPEDRSQAKVTIELQDQTIALDREQRTRDWGASEGGQTLTDNAIAQSILAEYGWRLEPGSGPGQTNTVVTQDKTDFVFLKERAEALGYELRLMFDEMYFGALRLAGKPQSPLLLYAGPDSNCLSFKIEEESTVPDEVVTASVDTAGTGTTEETVLTPDLPILGSEPANAAAQAAGVPVNRARMRQEGDTPPEAARMLAQAKINEASLSIKAEAVIDSTIYGHVLLPGKLVTVDGVGVKYGGRYYVDSIEHVFDALGYTQKAVLLKNGINEV
jgi:phage protein D